MNALHLDEELLRPELFDTPALIAYLTREHHDLLRVSLPGLQMLASEAARRPGRHGPTLRVLADLVDDLIDAILPHLDEEEHHIFPVLAGRRPIPAGFGRTLLEMRDEGHTVLHLVRRLKLATDSFRAPSDASPAHCALFLALAQLARALEAHVAIEVDVLLTRWGTELPAHPGAKPAHDAR